MKLYRAMVFDVGGTLLRFDLDRLAQAYLTEGRALGQTLDFARTRAMVADLELELPKRTQARALSLEEGYGAGFWDEFYGEGFRRLGLHGDLSAAAAEIRRRFQRAEFEALFEDAAPALDALAARGVLLGIVSNFSPNCEAVLRRVGIHDCFSFFVVSGIAGVEKPDPRIFDLAVRAANRSRAEIVYVGDSLYHDVEGAAGAGLDAILVDRTDRHPQYAGPRVRDLCELVEYVE